MKATRQVFEKLTHSSIMRLNESSMDKLFDLMLMGFKYQFLVCTRPEQLKEIMLTHLAHMRSCITSKTIIDGIMDVERQIQFRYSQLSDGDWSAVRQTLALFFQDKRMKVSLFLQEGIQSNDGRIHLPPPTAPAGRDRIGTIRVFSDSGVASSSVDTGASSTASHFHDHPVVVGGNMYAKDQPAYTPPRGAGTAAAAGASSPPPAASSASATADTSSPSSHAATASPAAKAPFPRPKSTSMTVDDVLSSGSQQGAKEMNALASLIGKRADKPETFKLNLFNDSAPSSREAGRAAPSIRMAHDVIQIDAPRAEAAVASVVKDFDNLGPSLDGGNDDDDDLLDMLDQAG